MNTSHKTDLSISIHSLPTPIFFARTRGKSLPRLHKARVEGNRDNGQELRCNLILPLKLMQPDAEAVGPMKPLQGPTPITGEK